MKLAEVLDHPGAMAILVEPFKRKCMRFDKTCFKDGDITDLNKYVAIIGGDAAEFLHGAYQSIVSGTPAHHAVQDASLLSNSSDFGFLHDCYLRAGNIHKFGLRSYFTP